mmetsp:Transcript_15286/g.12981  ORF Transcript_15286/g.12981 Transcript_15286/m.12981 type:complete len:135 (-) Transcript_15286:36-440(-)
MTSLLLVGAWLVVVVVVVGAAAVVVGASVVGCAVVAVVGASVVSVVGWLEVVCAVVVVSPELVVDGSLLVVTGPGRDVVVLGDAVVGPPAGVVVDCAGTRVKGRGVGADEQPLYHSDIISTKNETRRICSFECI